MQMSYMKIDNCQVQLVDVLFLVTEKMNELFRFIDQFKILMIHIEWLVVSIGGHEEI